MVRLLSKVSLVYACLLSVTTPVVAEKFQEETDNSFSYGDAGVLTITVTPQWQPVDPQDLPITIDVLDAEELDSTGISNTLELQNKIPGFSLKTNIVLGQPYLRGIGSDIISAGSEASVATFIDGVYMTRATRSVLDFHDIQHVDVMKGPQGVQLGRNVVGGAVSIVSKDPVPYFEASADALYGSFNRRQARGMINLPISDSDFSLRLSALTNKREGYSENIFLGRDIDDEDYQAFRAKLRYHPSADSDVVLSVETSSEDSTRASAHHPDPVHGINGGILNGGTVPNDPRDVTHNLAASNSVDTTLSSLRISRYFGDTELRAITGYQSTDLSLVIDLDATEVDFATNRPTETSAAFSQEVRLLSGQNDPLDWLVGLYYLHENADQTIDVRLPLANFRNLAVANVETNSYAVFGELSYTLKPGWRGIAGLRYSNDWRKQDIVQTIEDPGGVLGPPGTVILLQNEEESWDALTPEVTLEYSPDEDMLVYAKASRGYKSGGFNTTTVQPAFNSEDLRAFEAGFKMDNPMRNIQLNVALFYYDYKDIQLLTPPENAPVGTFPIVINAAEATIMGIDMSGSIQLTDNLELSMGMELLDAEFDRFVSIDPNNPTNDPNHASDPLPQAPHLSLYLGSAYRWQTDTGKYTTRLGYRYQSTAYFNPYKDRAVRQDGYGLLDASIAYEDMKGRWFAELFGKNITDELYARSIIRLEPVTGVARFWGDPRTIGLRVGIKF